MLWMRGKFSACIPYRLNHRYSIYGFDQGLELCTCGGIKFIEQFLNLLYNIKIVYYNFFCNEFCTKSALQGVSLTLQCKFV